VERERATETLNHTIQLKNFQPRWGRIGRKVALRYFELETIGEEEWKHFKKIVETGGDNRDLQS